MNLYSFLLYFCLYFQAEEIYKYLVEAISQEPESPEQHSALAWVLAHRSYVWTVRNERGQYKPDTMTRCLDDLATAREHAGTSTAS